MDGRGRMAGIVVERISENLKILGQSERFIFGLSEMPEPLGAFKLDNIFTPVAGAPSVTNFETRNKDLSGFRWVHTTNAGDTFGSYKLQSFVNAQATGTDILLFNQDGTVTFTSPVSFPSFAVTGDFNMDGYKIINLADPVNDQDAATKAFVVSLVGSGTITLSGAVSGSGNVGADITTTLNTVAIDKLAGYPNDNTLFLRGDGEWSNNFAKIGVNFDPTEDGVIQFANGTKDAKIILNKDAPSNPWDISAIGYLSTWGTLYHTPIGKSHAFFTGANGNMALEISPICLKIGYGISTVDFRKIVFYEGVVNSNPNQTYAIGVEIDGLPSNYNHLRTQVASINDAFNWCYGIDANTSGEWMRLNNSGLNLYNKRIFNVADPVDDQDLVTKLFLQTYVQDAIDANFGPAVSLPFEELSFNWSYASTTNPSPYQFTNTLTDTQESKKFKYRVVSGLTEWNNEYTLIGNSDLNGIYKINYNAASSNFTPLSIIIYPFATSQNLMSITVPVDMGGFEIRNALNPTTPQSLTTRAYVDNKVSTNSITLTGAVTGSGAGTISTTLTPITTSQISNFNSSVTTFRLDQFAIPTASINLNSQRIINVASPTAATDGTNRTYVDSKTWTTSQITDYTAATNALIAAATIATNKLSGFPNTTVTYLRGDGTWANFATAASVPSLVNVTGGTQTFQFNSTTAKFILANTISPSVNEYQVNFGGSIGGLRMGVSGDSPANQFSYINTSGGSPIYLQSDGVTKMYMNGQGSFVVGTSPVGFPYAKFDVHGGELNVLNEETVIRATSSTGSSKIEINNTSANGHLYELRSNSDGTFDIVDRTAVASRFKLSASGAITTGVWNGSVIASQYGGTGVNNGGRTLQYNGNVVIGGTLNTNGNFSTNGAFTVNGTFSVNQPVNINGGFVTSGGQITLRTPSSSDVTLPTSGTLATQAYVDNAVDNFFGPNVSLPFSDLNFNWAYASGTNPTPYQFTNTLTDSQISKNFKYRVSTTDVLAREWNHNYTLIGNSDVNGIYQLNYVASGSTITPINIAVYPFAASQNRMTMGVPINMGGFEITNALNPTTAQSLATRAYVDSAVAGSGGSVTLTGAVTGIGTGTIATTLTPTVNINSASYAFNLNNANSSGITEFQISYGIPYLKFGVNTAGAGNYIDSIFDNFIIKMGGTDRFIFSSVGNLGIGGSGPTQAKLVVNGGVQNITNEESALRVISSLGNVKIELQNTAASGKLYEIRSSSTGQFDITDRTGSATRFTITTLGNTGIGTNTPNAPLQLANTLANRQFVLYEGANNNFQFHGFGSIIGGLGYNIIATTDSHVFFAGANSTTRNEVARISGTGTAQFRKITGYANTKPNIGSAGSLGVGATFTINGSSSELSGTITIFSGTSGNSSGPLVGISLLNVMPNSNWGVILFPGNSSAAQVTDRIFAVVANNFQFTINARTALQNNVTYIWNYHIIGA
jgi:hypothetical protein